MNNPISALVRTAFDTGARFRHARVFHPRGVRLTGRFHAEPEFEPLFGTGERAVIARLSKGTGIPGAGPDILGLAFRVLAQGDRPWDFTLATSGQGTVGRFVLTVARGWASARFGTLLPYSLPDSGPAWFFADPDPGQPEDASLVSMARHVQEHQIGYTLTAAGFGGEPRRVGHLTLRAANPEEHRTDFFDPMLNHPGDVALLPRQVQWLRELAYTGSRRGRGAENGSGHAVGTTP